MKSLKTKILAAVLVPLIAGIFFETFIWANNTVSHTRKTIENSFTAALEVANQNFSASMKDIERMCALAEATTGDASSIRNYFRVMDPASDADDKQKLEAQRNASQFLRGLCRFQYYLSGVSVNDLHGHQQTFGIFMDSHTFTEQSWMKEFLDGDENSRWIGPHESVNGLKVFSVVRKIKNGKETAGIIAADVNVDILEDCYRIPGYTVYITDSQGDSAEVIHPAGVFPEAEDNEGQRVVLEQPVTGWTVYGLIPMEKIREDVRRVFGKILVISALMNIMICLIISFVISYMTKELSILAEGVKKVSGNQMELPVAIQTKDEVGELYIQIEHMLNRIRELIREIQESEETKRELEILALQEQINPHFLYNTLNTITYLAQLRGISNIQFVSSALSDMLHLALSPEKYITVEQEITYLQQYLAIMEYKYSGKFASEFDVEDEALSCLVPKMILQPLVENSLKHGIATLSRPGYIRITAGLDKGKLKLTVWDNGNGVPADVLARVNQMPDNKQIRSGKNTGIGVYNVRDRICLLFGEKGHFEMSSVENVYTVAEIELPADWVEELRK